YVTGTSVRSLIDAGPVPVADAIQICRQLLAGLGPAHRQGIIHRHIKPDNLLLSGVTGLRGPGRNLDFGRGKLLPATTSLRTGIPIDTPIYMAPEQASGEPVDARSDLYSTGIVLYELLTGRKPFVAEQMADVLRLQREMEPPPMRAVAPDRDVPSQLEK